MTKTPDITPEAAEYFIQKRGYYYRPDDCGYTDRPILAGLYTEAEAKATTHPNGEDGPRDGMRYFHESECKDGDYVMFKALSARLAEVEAERERLENTIPAIKKVMYSEKGRAEAAEARIKKLEAKLAKVVEIAKRRGDYVPLGTVECRGDKCREPWCISCCGEDAAEMALYKMRKEYSEDGATLAELKGEKDE
jgi:hypothetical protein